MFTFTAAAGPFVLVPPAIAPPAFTHQGCYALARIIARLRALTRPFCRGGTYSNALKASACYSSSKTTAVVRTSSALIFSLRETVVVRHGNPVFTVPHASQDICIGGALQCGVLTTSAGTYTVRIGRAALRFTLSVLLAPVTCEVQRSRTGEGERVA